MSQTVDTAFSLLVRAGGSLCALPLGCVVETLRPSRLQAMPAAPPFVRGVSNIRGEAVPVVDLAALLGESVAVAATRLVVIRVSGHHVAVAVSEVLGVHEHDPEALQSLPSLAGNASAGVAVAIEHLDEQFLLVLDAARLVPPDALERLTRRALEISQAQEPQAI